MPSALMTPVLADPPNRPTATQLRAERVVRARQAVARSGVPEWVMVAAEQRGPVDWPRLAGVVSSVFVMTGSGLGQQSFWSTAAPELDDRTPLQMLPGPDGVNRVARYARVWAKRRRSARSLQVA
jgi:hypothetical protein